jgi:hypothetical protein
MGPLPSGFGAVGALFNFRKLIAVNDPYNSGSSITNYTTLTGWQVT